MMPDSHSAGRAAVERELQALFVRRAIGVAEPADLAAWATAALVSGWDARDLAALAGLPPPYDAARAEHLFREVLADMDRAEPPVGETLTTHGRLLAESALDGRLPPPLAAERIHAEVVEPLGHPEDLVPWCFLALGMAPPADGEPEDESFEAGVRRQAETLLKRIAAAPLVPWDGVPPVTPHDAPAPVAAPTPAHLGLGYRLAAGALAAALLAGAVVLVGRDPVGWAGWLGVVLSAGLALLFTAAAVTGRNFDWQSAPPGTGGERESLVE